MYCHNCGAKVSDHSKFCRKCGVSLMNENNAEQVKRVNVKVKQRQAPKQQSYVINEKPTRRSHWFLWLLILILVASIVFLYYSPFTRELFIYTDMDFNSTIPLPDVDEIIKLNQGEFDNCFLWRLDNSCEIINLETGVTTNKRQLESEASGMLDITIETQDSYAYVKETLTLFDAVSLELTYYFRRASLLERAYFVYKLLSLRAA